MKQDTKKLILVGGAALAAVYALSTMGGDDDYTGMGGGGGMPLLPIIPEPETQAAPAATIINLPAINDVNPFGENPFGESVVEDGGIKKTVIEPSTAGIIPSTGGIIPTSSEGLPPWEVSGMGTLLNDAASTKKSETGRTQEGVATSDVLNWNFQDAANNVGLWMLGAPQPPKPSGATKSDATTSKKAGIANVSGTSKTMVTRLVANRSGGGGGGGSRYTGGFNAAGGFSRVRISADNPKGVPGWKQVGAKKPTSPGQPNRY